MHPSEFNSKRDFWEEEMRFLGAEYEKHADTPHEVVLYFDELLERADTMEQELYGAKRGIECESRLLFLKSTLSHWLLLSEHPAQEYLVRENWLREIGNYQYKIEAFKAFCGEVADKAKQGIDRELHAMMNAGALEKIVG